MGGFNFLDVNWKYHTAIMSRSWKFLKFVGHKFLPQVLSGPTRKDALLEMLFVNREGLVGGVTAGSCLGHSDQKWLSLKFSV